MKRSPTSLRQESPLLGRRVAFFGGSFDPPHLGHLAVARAARQALSLDIVLFAPVGSQPLKPMGSTAPFADRLAMTRLAIEAEPSFQVSLLDAPSESGRPNYTLDTLHRLRSQLPPDGSLFCLMGADSFFSLPGWHRGAEIPFAASLIVASRPGQHLDDIAAHLPQGLALGAACQLPRQSASPVEVRCYTITGPGGVQASFNLLPDLDVEISASAIREQIRSSPDLRPADVLPPAVAAYIREHGLYR